MTIRTATVFRGEHDCASRRVRLPANAGASVEYLPDPPIPFKDSQFRRCTEVTVSPGAIVVVCGSLRTGRLARTGRVRQRSWYGVGACPRLPGRRPRPPAPGNGIAARSHATSAGPPGPAPRDHSSDGSWRPDGRQSVLRAR
ncbi:urease accessory protein UreD [Streptomyces sp. NPDC002669]|uniref:urease accessory protein UreD n=1 Tax=Streptomyces sp. NPDC002669 TaxID=3364658 RepID=UPI0036961B42